MDLTDIEHFIHFIQTQTFIFSAPHNFLQKWSHAQTQNTSQQIHKNWNNLLSDHHGLKLGINNNRNNRKFKTLGNWTTHYWIKKKSRQQLRKKVEDFLEFSENENTTYLNLWDTMKAVLRGKFIALIAYIKNLEILY